MPSSSTPTARLTLTLTRTNPNPNPILTLTSTLTLTLALTLAGEHDADMVRFHEELPRLLRPGGVYSFFNGKRPLA